MYENSYNPQNLGGLITNTYILAVVFAVVFVGLSILIANMIAYEGGKNPTDPKRRKVWFFVLAAVNFITFFLWNFLFVAKKIIVPAAKDKFLMHNGISTVIALVLFLLLGFVLSKVMKKGKYGTIFP